eukprot:493154-Hanusia_phi.AAC.1
MANRHATFNAPGEPVDIKVVDVKGAPVLDQAGKQMVVRSDTLVLAGTFRCVKPADKYNSFVIQGAESRYPYYLGYNPQTQTIMRFATRDEDHFQFEEEFKKHITYDSELYPYHHIPGALYTQFQHENLAVVRDMKRKAEDDAEAAEQ